jgi:hypothetical protein
LYGSEPQNAAPISAPSTSGTSSQHVFYNISGLCSFEKEHVKEKNILIKLPLNILTQINYVSAGKTTFKEHRKITGLSM